MIRMQKTGRRAGAFTLIELLVVMAITVILLGLVFGPMMQGFNLTNRARVQVLVQDTARRVMEMAQRDVSNGVFVFDNTTEPLWFWVKSRTGANVPLPVFYASVDLVPPVRFIDQQGYGFLQQHPELIDPTTGEALANPDLRDRLAQIGAEYVHMADPALPLAPGRVLVRYWVGLRDNATQADPNGSSGRPLHPYTNVYEDPVDAPPGEHNPAVLYRAVLSPYTASGAVDTRFFHVGSRGGPVVYDPNFFYDHSPAVRPADPAIADESVPGWRDLNNDGVVQIAENWRAIARPLIPADKGDGLTTERQENGTPVYMQISDPRGTGAIEVPKMTSLARFQPTFIGNDAGVPTTLDDPGNEMPFMAPPTHQETYGHWTTPYRLYVFRSSLSANPLRYFTYDGGAGQIRYQEYDQSTGQLSVDNAAGFYPSNYNAGANGVDMSRPPLSTGIPPQLMFSVDPRKGLVNFAFPDWIWLHDGQGRPTPSRFDPASVNAQYDAVAAMNGPGNAARYATLAVLDTALNGTATSPLVQIPNARVVPGTETVVGPDQRPGPNRGRLVTYTRVARAGDIASIGLNEYMINYTDLPNRPPSPGTDPVTQQNYYLNAAGTIIFNSRVDASGSRNAMPTVTADGRPVEPIRVNYQIQNNLPGDVVKADYLTRQLMTFALGVRLYDLRDGRPQQVNLTQKINVRNLQR